MPTGYTNTLDEKDMTTRQWIMEQLSRNFGVCITLKEESFDLTEEQILQSLSDDSSTAYHEKELKEAEVKAVEIAKFSMLDWRNLWKKDQAESKKQNDESNARRAKMKARHDRVIADLEKLRQSDVGEFTKNVAEFGLSQLEMVDYECKPYPLETMTLQEYIRNTKKSVTSDIEYHTTELATAKERVKERLRFYKQLRSDVERVLGSPSCVDDQSVKERES